MTAFSLATRLRVLLLRVREAFPATAEPGSALADDVPIILHMRRLAEAAGAVKRAHEAKEAESGGAAQ